MNNLQLTSMPLSAGAVSKSDKSARGFSFWVKLHLIALNESRGQVLND